MQKPARQGRQPCRSLQSRSMDSNAEACTPGATAMQKPVIKEQQQCRCLYLYKGQQQSTWHGSSIDAPHLKLINWHQCSNAE